MTDSESLYELIEKLRGRSSEELLEMAASPDWALPTHEAIRIVLEERGVPAPPIPGEDEEQEGEALPAPAVTERAGQLTEAGETIRAGQEPTAAQQDPTLPPSPEVAHGQPRRRSAGPTLFWLLVAGVLTYWFVDRDSSCSGESGTRVYLDDAETARILASQRPDLRAIGDELERLKGDVPSSAVEDGGRSPSASTAAAGADGGPAQSEESAPEQPPNQEFAWPHGARLSSAATLAVMGASRLCESGMTVERKNPLTGGKVFGCSAAGYPVGGPVIAPTLVFQGAAVGSFSGMGKTEVITSLFGNDLRHKSLGASALLGYEQGALTGLARDHLLSLWDCVKILADGHPDRLLCVSSEGQELPGLGTPDASSSFTTNLVLVSASDSKLQTLPLVHLDKGAIHCGINARAAADLSDPAQNGDTISVILERAEDKCPAIPSALKLHWKLSDAGATPDKQTKGWIQRLGIQPGLSSEARGE